MVVLTRAPYVSPGVRLKTGTVCVCVRGLPVPASPTPTPCVKVKPGLWVVNAALLGAEYQGEPWRAAREWGGHIAED